MWDLLIVLTIIMFAVVAYSWFKSRTAEVVSARALVLRKRLISPDNYLVTFGMPGIEKELTVGMDVYLANDEGQWGNLTYQGEILREWVPEPKDEPYQPAPRKSQPLNPDYHEP
jgi:hypothetical protein